MKNTRILLLVLFVSLHFALKGQSVAPSIVSSAGNNASTADFNIAWTLGEVVNAKTSSLTQGFIQSEVNVTSTLENKLSKFSFLLYPNPVIGDYLTFESKTKDINLTNDIIVELIDINGALISSGKFDSIKGRLKIDMSELSAGNYYIRINSNLENKTYKIIKY